MSDTEWPETIQERRAHRLNDPRSRAVDTLIRAGRKADIDALYDSVGTQAQAAYRSIEEDSTRSDTWKQEQLDQEYERVKTSVADRLVSMARDAEHDDQRDATRVFGSAGLPGDAASLAISARDAADRVATADADDLRDLLDRATRMDDEVLARAVVRRAIDEGAAKVVNDFTERRPELLDATERLWDRARRSDQTGFGSTFQSLAIMPPGRTGWTR
ncbi:MAG: hypothetical protein M3445_08600 [Actinomycetota bacterium]|nr:hypothetical protein [Actinomycetota bacterium]